MLTGVLEDPPPNSSLKFDFALPVEASDPDNAWVDEWDNTGPRLFIRLAGGADHQAVSAKIKDLVDEHVS